MTFCNKIIILSLLVAGTFGRHLRKRSESNTTDETTDETTEESVLNEESIFHNTTEVSEDECSCNHRYFKHYAVKGCVIEEEDSCGCPKKFHCPQNQNLNTSNVCVYKDQEYPVRAEIPSPNVCQVCWCVNKEDPHISCISKDCPTLSMPSKGNCFELYEEGRCCPVGFKCVPEEVENTVIANETCEYGGTLYPFGSQIYPEDDRCQICSCNEDWNGTNSTCHHVDCFFERRKKDFDAGCIPIYHEKSCCPIQFYCPSSNNFSYSLLSSNETEIDDAATGDKCSFGEQYFNIGDVVSTGAHPCVTCTCLVPPELTCIRRSCPSPPSEENCQPIYNRNECCPSYDCLYADSEPSDPGVCPTPLCADSSCRIETPPGHECPTCVCGERFSELEHNNVQQQTQQISQNVEPFHEVYVGNTDVENDFSVEQLQMMPIRMQEDSEGDFSVAESIDSEFENPEEGSEKELNGSDNSFSEIESSDEPSKFLENDEENLLVKAESGESERESDSKEVHKRSEMPLVPTLTQFEISDSIEQEQSFGQFPEALDDLEREGSEIENAEDFEDELVSYRKKVLAKNDTTINEIINIDHLVEVPVPPGCPTPLCEGPWCKIGIPEGHSCPTCICKRPTEP